MTAAIIANRKYLIQPRKRKLISMRWQGVKIQCTKPVVDIAAGTYPNDSIRNAYRQVRAKRFITQQTVQLPAETMAQEFNVAIEIAATCALKAIAIKTEQNDSEIATYEYFITA